MGFSTKKYVIEKEYTLPRTTVWKLLSDTDRLNQFIGLFPAQFSQAKKETGHVFYREALAKVYGLIPLSWQEYPFQWVEEESYSIERHYLGGPLKHFYGGVKLFDIEKGPNTVGTRVHLFAEFTPANPIGLAAIPITGSQSMKNTIKYLDEYINMNAQTASSVIPQKQTLHNVNVSELTRLEASFKQMPVSGHLVEKLHDYLTTRSDQDVAKMRPAAIAKAWGADSDDVLRLFLYATKVGILNLSWNLICPNCRVSKTEYSSLSHLQKQFHCDLCGINYDANFDNNVELYFSVHPTVRTAYHQTYCVGGPTISPHVKIQKIIKKGDTTSIKLPQSGDAFRLRVLQANAIVSIEKGVDTVTQNAVLQYTADGWSSNSLPLESGQQSIDIHNSSTNDIVLVVEQTEWSNEITTAAKVTAMQEFRDLFSSEVLAPGQQVGIENVTILFSDIQGSTSLYETVGDATAYGQVRQHFEFLTQWIAKNSGSVVKTIGDAVMAVFHLPEDGFKAALQIQKHISEFNKDLPEDITLKIGLYNGPVIAVNSNDRLDYFGRTVNIAARIQGQSVGNDIVLSSQLLSLEQVSALLEKENLDVETFKATLKGIEENFELTRIRIN